nr:MAG TPA: hypothetical protein [Caudoviricetes sp.]
MCIRRTVCIIWSTILLPFKTLITTEFIPLKLLKG